MSETQNQRGLYRRLLRYAFAYKSYLILSVIGFALYAAMETALASTIKFFIDRLEDKPSDPLFNLSSEITSAMWFLPTAILVLSFFRSAGSFLGNFFMARVGLNVVNTLRKAVFSHMLYLPQSYYDAKNSGELVSLIIYNIEQVTASVTNAIKILLRDGFMVIAFLSYLLYLNWLLTLLFFLIAPIMGGIIYFASQYFRKTSRRVQSAVGQVTHVATESIQGIKLVKSYAGERYEKSRFADAADTNLKFSTKYERVSALQTPVLQFVIAIALSMIFLLIVNFWQGDTADAIIYITLAGLLTRHFKQLSTVNSMIQRGMAAAETIFFTMDSEPEVDKGRRALDKARGKIEFRDVSFRYHERDQEYAIDHLNLIIAPGETVALVGASGSGKTTIASLLLRFYNNTSGVITIDDIPINEISIRDLRHNIALVNQQTILFNDSVRGNIAYGRDLQDVAADEISAAARNANAEGFINDMEDGFDTPVGEDGGRLSGGQRQRIAIARALLKNAPILILDEATSALDNESEKQIQQALETLKEGRTTIVIAHRLSTIEKADRIIVLHQGKIIEQGDHASLMAKGGAYAELHRAQIASEI